MSLLSVSVESELSFLWKNHNGALKEVALSDLVAKKKKTQKNEFSYECLLL